MSKPNASKSQEVFPSLEEQIEARDKKRAKDGLAFIEKYCEENDLQVEADPRVQRQGRRLIIDAVWQVRALPLKPKLKPKQVEDPKK